MRDSQVTAFQARLTTDLRSVFVDVPVEAEWASIRGTNRSYSPRLDAAVGPFAVDDLIYEGEYNQLAKLHLPLMQRLYELGMENLRDFGEPADTELAEVLHRNANARCFLAIEIENKVTRKHLMGGAINAAALGRIGLAVGWTREKVKAFVKLRTYLLYLGRVGKNTFEPYNLLVLDPEQLSGAIREYLKQRKAQRRK